MIVDMVGLFLELDSENDIQVVERVVSGKEDYLIMVDDESDLFEVVEDNVGEFLVRLYCGDFEGIVVG